MLPTLSISPPFNIRIKSSNKYSLRFDIIKNGLRKVIKTEFNK